MVSWPSWGSSFLLALHCSLELPTSWVLTSPILLPADMYPLFLFLQRYCIVTPTFWIPPILSMSLRLSPAVFPCFAIPIFNFTETGLFAMLFHKHSMETLVIVTSGVTPGNDSLEYLLTYICMSISGLFKGICFHLKCPLFLPLNLIIWRTGPQKKAEAESIPGLS